MKGGYSNKCKLHTPKGAGTKAENSDRKNDGPSSPTSGKAAKVVRGSKKK